MKITYKENPLDTVVELDDQDRKVLGLAMRVDHLEYFVVHMYMHFNEVGKQDVADAKAEADREYNKIDSADQWMAERVKLYEENLRGSHVGDCTCVACSCDKCYAESMLGIDTIPGLGSHEADYIAHAFQEDDVITASDAIRWLENHVPDANGDERLESHIPRWNREKTDAAKWLKEYQKTHLTRS